MGFQKSDRFMHPSFTSHEVHHADDPTAPVFDHVASSSNDQEDAREGSGSPQPATDDSSTDSPVPSAGDPGPENASYKSSSKDQELLNLKDHSLRQRTAQACDKCRERKTKCSGHRPVCTRCTNRGLLCEYTVRESRTRSTMRHRTVPSLNPFQVNYRSGGGRPTPAYHSRMGNSQTNAYARPPYDYAMSLFGPSVAPPPYMPPAASSSTDQLGSGNNDLDAPYARHPAHIKKHPDLRRELKGWDFSPLAQSHASYFERQRAVSNSVYSPETSPTSQEKDLLYYMGRNSTAKSALNSSVQAMQLDERTALHGMPLPVSVPETAYHPYSTQVHYRFLLHDILLTMIRSNGTIITSSEDGPGLSSGSTSSASSQCPSGLSTEHEAYDYSEDDTPPLGSRVRGHPGANAEWNKLGLPLPHIQDMSVFTVGYDAAIAHYSSPYAGYDKSGISNPMGEDRRGGNTGSRVGFIRPAPSVPINMDVYGGHAPERSAYSSEDGYSSQDGFQNSELYEMLVHDTPENMHSYSAPPVSDPGNRFEGYAFFK